MWTAFSLVILALAARSDREIPDEEAWIQRFEAIDRLREKYGVPSLTAAERIRVVIGEPPLDHRYGLYLQERSSGSYGRYGVILMVWREFPSSSKLVEKGEWIGIKDVEETDPDRQALRLREEAMVYVQSLADRMFLPFVHWGG
jgi:hypothetical protein